MKLLRYEKRINCRVFNFAIDFIRDDEKYVIEKGMIHRQRLGQNSMITTKYFIYLQMKTMPKENLANDCTIMLKNSFLY